MQSRHTHTHDCSQHIHDSACIHNSHAKKLVKQPAEKAKTATTLIDLQISARSLSSRRARDLSLSISSRRHAQNARPCGLSMVRIMFERDFTYTQSTLALNADEQDNNGRVVKARREKETKHTHMGDVMPRELIVFDVCIFYVFVNGHCET